MRELRFLRGGGADGDISRLRRGELRLAEADSDLATVLDLCAEAQTATRGHFSAIHQGQIDPTGLVKGWAIERASLILRRHGSRNHAVNGGGDMQLAGQAAPGRPWRVGISDPRDHNQVVTIVAGSDLAVATSGTSERGNHIMDPFTGRPTKTRLCSATVVGPSLTRADAYATAAFVMGQAAIRWAEATPDYEVLLIGPDGVVSQSADWPRSSLRPALVQLEQAVSQRKPGIPVVDSGSHLVLRN